MNLVTVLQLISCAPAVLSAGLWYAASKVVMPPHTEDSWEGRGPFQEAIARQSRVNAQAALSASIAALFQVLSYVAIVVQHL